MRAAWTLILLTACATSNRDPTWVENTLRERTGIRPLDAPPPGELDEDHAVALALARSPSYAADLARLASARADFEEASRLSNPSLSLLIPVGPIEGTASLLGPVLDLLRLPQRTEAARRELESVAESLVQSGLDLVRDVRLAHVDARTAAQRLEVLETLQTLAEQVAELGERRAGAGEISPADALALHADAYVAADQVAVARRELAVARARLATLIGAAPDTALEVVASRPTPSGAPALPILLELARRERPELRAAALSLEGAGARAGWERSRIIDLTGQIYLQGGRGRLGARVGGTLSLPIFNQNQGGVGRAEAEALRAAHRLRAAGQRIGLEVLEARTRLAQGVDSLARFTEQVLPPLEGGFDAARLAFQLGDASYLVVLDAARRLGTARLRITELEADVRRAHAELERATGARLPSPLDGEPS